MLINDCKNESQKLGLLLAGHVRKVTDHSIPKGFIVLVLWAILFAIVLGFLTQY